MFYDGTSLQIIMFSHNKVRWSKISKQLYLSLLAKYNESNNRYEQNRKTCN